LLSFYDGLGLNQSAVKLFTGIRIECCAKSEFAKRRDIGKVGYDIGFCIGASQKTAVYNFTFKQVEI